MKKIETIWHHLLYSALTEANFKFTQQDLAKSFGYSLSTIHHALIIPSQIGAIRKESKYFVLQDFQKLLYYWASVRNLAKDILYSTYYDGSVAQLETLMPPFAIYAAYSSAKKLLGEAPADYSKVYVYVNPQDLEQFKTRFNPVDKKAKTKPNTIFALSAPKTLSKYGQITSLPQTFVDIWNLKDWYGKDFTHALEDKMYGILS